MASDQVKRLARTIIEDPALEELRELVQMRLFNRFRTATPAERDVINHILDNEGLFFTEVQSVYDEARQLEAEDSESN